MDLNKFKALSINNENNFKSPIRKLRSRTVYPNITLTTVAGSSSDSGKSSSKTSCQIDNSTPSSLVASSDCSLDINSCASNSRIHISYDCNENNEDVLDNDLKYDI